MVNSVSFPQPTAYSGGIDFSPLAKLGDVYQQGQERAAQQDVLGRLGSDPTVNAQMLIQSGVPSLAQLGMRMQQQAATAAEDRRQFDLGFGLRQSQDTRAAEELRIRQAQEERAAKKDEESTPEFREAQVKSRFGGVVPPEWQPYVQTGASAPSYTATEELKIRQAQEGRAVKKAEEDTADFRKSQMEGWIKDGTIPPEARKDPAWLAWMTTGQNFPTLSDRRGLGQSTFTVGPDGEVHEYQKTSRGDPVEVKYPEGQRPMLPGEVAQQKAEGTSMGKARATAIQQLPKLSDLTALNLQSLQELKDHPGRDQATGAWNAQLGDTNPLLGQTGIDFRNKLAHVKSQSFLSGFETLKGAGAISDAEGKAATAAINRLSAATSAKEFDSAIEEVQKYYTLGLDRLRRAAKGDFSEHPTELLPRDYKAPPAGSTPPAQAGSPVTQSSNREAIHAAALAEIERRKKENAPPTAPISR